MLERLTTDVHNVFAKIYSFFAQKTNDNIDPLHNGTLLTATGSENYI